MKNRYAAHKYAAHRRKNETAPQVNSPEKGG